MKRQDRLAEQKKRQAVRVTRVKEPTNQCELASSDEDGDVVMSDASDDVKWLTFRSINRAILYIYVSNEAGTTEPRTCHMWIIEERTDEEFGDTPANLLV